MTPRPRSLDWLAYAAGRLGAPGLLGLMLLAAAGALALHGHALIEKANALEAHLAAVAHATAQAPVAPSSRPALPPAREAPTVLAGLFEAARHAGLTLDEGNYRVTTDHPAGLLRQQITLPLSGRYPAVRDFLAQALNRHPSLTLDSLRLEDRKSVV
jgi:hypothetical protein